MDGPGDDRGELQGIQEVADMLGITPRTLRFYEDKGLIEPCRIGTTRVYRRREIARMQLILRGKRLGFSLTDIAEFLDLYDADPQHLEQMRALAERVRMRIDELEQQRDALDQTLADLAKLEGEALARVHAHEPEAQRAAG
ncbi:MULTISPECIES: MerR family DNA-binding transcriptional regulator [unclassified Sphingomonas]|jgi:DNA-binding transcriptional MerR regulator|uniref:MerR family transcriptional regulator n=1 Tax=unclassified Sphingomonas TaxID=196159 RepID=UPI0025CC1F63|nr:MULTISPECIES: MerR family DNA-binding transcriptional regulator [unclassified Sphingomonas]